MTAALESKLLANEMAQYAAAVPETVTPRIHMTFRAEDERDFFLTIDALGGPARFKVYDSYAALINEPSPLTVSVYPPYTANVARFREPLLNKVAEMQENIKAVEAELSDA